VKTGNAIQATVFFSAILGVFFLIQVYLLLDPLAFEIIALGWVLFVFDGLLTFTRPRASYYLAFLLAFLALFETLSQPAHYSLVLSGNIPAAATILAGSAAQVILLVLVPYHFSRERRKNEWAWPGAKSQA
jgi:hypothetical protein